MSTQPDFLAWSETYAALLIEQIREHKNIRTYNDQQWRDYRASLPQQFGRMEKEYLEWIVLECKKLNRSFKLDENDEYAFGEAVYGINKGMEELGRFAVSRTTLPDNPSFFGVEFKDRIIVPALFPKLRAKPTAAGPKTTDEDSPHDGGDDSSPSTPKSGMGGHLTLVHSGDPKNE